MTDLRKRADRWKAKYNLKRVNETLTDLREDMAQNGDCTGPRPRPRGRGLSPF